jgi:PAS domain S-box-containing protein
MREEDMITQGKEVFFDENEIIVSKTDPRGRITYANDVFLRVSGYTEEEVIGKPHSMIRHPNMPRCVFKLLWETIQSGNEIFAYVVNKCKNGDYYWVYAHVTPTFDHNRNIIGFHSNRRCPDRKAIATIEKMYGLLLAEENKYADPRKGLEASYDLFRRTLQETEKPYEEFIWTLHAS